MSKLKYLTIESKGVKFDGRPLRSTHYSAPRGRGGESWKLEVGAECNLLLEHAEYNESLRGLNGANPYLEVAKAIRSIVARVAEFEKLEAE